MGASLSMQTVHGAYVFHCPECILCMAVNPKIFLASFPAIMPTPDILGVFM